MVALHKSHLFSLNYQTAYSSPNKSSTTNTSPVFKSVFSVFVLHWFSFHQQCLSTNHSRKPFLFLLSVHLSLIEAFAWTPTSTFLQNKTAHKQHLAQPNYLSPGLQIAVLSVRRYKAIYFLARLQLILLLLCPSKRTKTLPYVPISILFQCGSESQCATTIGMIRLSGYYAWDNQSLILQNPIPPSNNELPLSADFKWEVTEMVALLNDGAFATKGTTVPIKKFHVAPYCHEDLFLKVNLINDPEILLIDISDGHAFSFLMILPCVSVWLYERNNFDHNYRHGDPFQDM